MPKVELVYDSECPNVAAARTNLRRAFARSGLRPAWHEHRIGDPTNPPHLRGVGSPSIFINGCDIAQAERTSDSSCRIYIEDGTIIGAPAVDTIAGALMAVSRAGCSGDAALLDSTGRGRLRSFLAFWPGATAALLPKIVCPACSPVYATLVGATGLTVLMQETWLVPISIVLLLVSVAALLASARRKAPRVTGLTALAAIVTGKFVLDAPVVAYVGLATFVAASVWTGRSHKPTAICYRAQAPGCNPKESPS
jgi:hypothetical protein